MNSEALNRLIEASLADGVLTEQERSVIKKRAMLEGFDPDEIDVILESKLYEIRKKAEEAVAKVRKCPACGAIISSLNTSCPQCGTELSTLHSNSSIQKLSEKIEEVENEFKNEGFLSRGFIGRKQIKLASTITSFPVPMGKEDLVEFIVSMRANWKNSKTNQEAKDEKVKKAYRAKYDEAVAKAQVKYFNDPAFQGLFAQAKKDNRWYIRHPFILYLLIFFCVAVLITLFVLFCVGVLP